MGEIIMENQYDLFNQKIIDEIHDEVEDFRINSNTRVRIVNTLVENIFDHPDNHLIYLGIEDELTSLTLKKDILENGIIHIPVCKKKGSDYILVDGHRRLRAIRALFAEGYTQFESIDIKVVSFDDATDELEFMLAANVKVRRPSDFSRMMQISAYSKIYDQRRKNNQISKDVSRSSYIANHMQMSERQTDKFLYIRNRFSSEEIKDLLDNPSVTINSFYGSLKSKGDDYELLYENKPGNRLITKEKEVKMFKLNKKERQIIDKFASDLIKLMETNEKALLVLNGQKDISIRLKRLSKSLITTVELLNNIDTSNEN